MGNLISQSRPITSTIITESLSVSPGMIFGVYHGNKIVTEEAVGLSSITRNERMSTSMSMRVGSVTKSFTGYIIHQLTLMGEVNVKDSACKVIPSYDLPSSITVENLLHHTSGLEDYAGHLDERGERTIDQLVKDTVVKTLKYPPGCGWNYSNTNYYLLGKLIEEVTSMSLLDSYSHYIFQPLNLTSTTINTSEFLSSGYVIENGSVYDVSKDDISYAFGCGNIVSTVSDIAKFIRVYARVSDHIPTVMTPAGSYGYGLGVLEYASDRWFGHNGEIAGFQTFAFHNVKSDKTVVVMANINRCSNGCKPATTIGKKLIGH